MQEWILINWSNIEYHFHSIIYIICFHSWFVWVCILTSSNCVFFGHLLRFYVESFFLGTISHSGGHQDHDCAGALWCRGATWVPCLRPLTATKWIPEVVIVTLKMKDFFFGGKRQLTHPSNKEFQGSFLSLTFPRLQWEFTCVRVTQIVSLPSRNTIWSSQGVWEF